MEELNSDYFTNRRKFMITLLKQQGIKDENVLNAMLIVPREIFVPEHLKKHAYNNTPLPLIKEQTISQPYTVAFMLQELGIKKGDKVLEIGTGSGYNAALISELVGPTGSVVTVEYLRDLVKYSKNSLKQYNSKNIETVFNNGVLGHKEKAPYDKIIVTASSPDIKQAWLKQLKDNGVLIFPQGHLLSKMLKVTKNGQHYTKKELGAFNFVPLIEKKEFEQI